MSYFHGPKGPLPLVFGGGKWIEDLEQDISCPSGAPAHVKFTAEFPLPQPPQDPITLLTSHGGHQELTGSCDVHSFDEDLRIVRTGD